MAQLEVTATLLVDIERIETEVPAEQRSITGDAVEVAIMMAHESLFEALRTRLAEHGWQLKELSVDSVQVFPAGS